jgi:hypothetical protein
MFGACCKLTNGRIEIITLDIVTIEVLEVNRISVVGKCFDHYNAKTLHFSSQIMFEVADRRSVKDCCEFEGRLSSLQTLNHGLEECQKSLKDYLDAKRNVFPRFFFVTDEELLSILGANNPTCVQEHVVKVGVTLCSKTGCNVLSSVN